MKPLMISATLALLRLLPPGSACATDCVHYGDYLHWVGGVKANGAAYGLTTEGSYAYLALAEIGFAIADFSDPQSPVLVHQSNRSCAEVAVSRHYAYIAEYFDPLLTVLDVTDPRAPAVVGQVALPCSATGIAATDAYVYLGLGHNGLQVIDVTDPANPQMRGRVRTDGYPNQIAVSGNHAYVVVDSGLRVIDISDPNNPFLLSALPTRGEPMDLAVSGGHAYLAESGSNVSRLSGLEVIDITDPSNPTSVGRVATSALAFGVALSGATAFLSTVQAGLQAVDITDPLHPEIVGHSWVDGWDVAVSGELACVGSMGGGWIMHVVDVTHPESSSTIGGVQTPDESYGLDINGTWAYVGDRVSGLQVVDFSDPANPRIVAEADLFWALGVAVSGSYAYVTFGYGPRHLAVVDVSDPLHPHELGSVELLGWAHGVATSGDYAYIGDGEAGMTVVDISNPHAPAFVANVPTPGYAHAIAIAGSHAYVADNRGLRVVDIKDPSQPRIVGSTTTPTHAIAVVGTTGYAGTPDGLQIIDLSNPATPVILSTVPTPARAVGVGILGGYAYVGSSTQSSDGTFDVQTTVIDVLDPVAPRIVGSLPVAGAVEVTEEHVCIASVQKGFHVAFLQCAAATVPMADRSGNLRLHLFPNPSPRGVTIRLRIPAADHVHASVIDVTGRTVDILNDCIPGPGEQDIHWNGRDEDGRDVAPGVYLVRARTPGETRTARVVILR